MTLPVDNDPDRARRMVEVPEHPNPFIRNEANFKVELLGCMAVPCEMCDGEPCIHCWQAEAERLREVLLGIASVYDAMGDSLLATYIRAVVGEVEQA